MPINNEFRVEGNVLIAAVTGKVDSPEELDQNTAIILEQMVSRGCTRILADDRNLDLKFDTFDLFKAASNEAEVHWSTPAEKFGVLLPEELRKDAEFYKDVAHNRGFRIQMFFDEAKAMKWIRE